MEKLIDLINIPTAEQVKCVTYYLKGDANNWWMLVKDNLVTSPAFSFADFKNCIENKYYPSELKWQKEEEFSALRMGTMTLQAYTDRFSSLAKFAKRIIPDEETKTRLYVRKMDGDLRTHMTSNQIPEFDKTYNKALGIYASQNLAEAESKSKRSLVPPVNQTSLIQKPTFIRPTFSRPDFQNNNNFPNRNNNNNNKTGTPTTPPTALITSWKLQNTSAEWGM
jgi:hypothetical protein